MNLKNILFITSLLLNFSVYSKDIEKVIYGDDNRMDIFESPSPLYQKLARSTAAMISSSSLNCTEDTCTLLSGTLEDDGICSDARFAKQPTAAVCSGFLVGPDLLLTAGHCIETMVDCQTYEWVFDYSNLKSSQSVFSINKNDIYKCSKIIARALDKKTFNDFALIKLDRVANRAPLSYRKSGIISKKEHLVVIGHPSGLPTKIADGAFVRSNKNKYFFQANLDTFGGNSGSAVFDSASGIVEGILVRGEEDYILDTTSKCYRPKVCAMDECRGEDVTRITKVLGLKK